MLSFSILVWPFLISINECDTDRYRKSSVWSNCPFLYQLMIMLHEHSSYNRMEFSDWCICNCFAAKFESVYFFCQNEIWFWIQILKKSEFTPTYRFWNEFEYFQFYNHSIVWKPVLTKSTEVVLCFVFDYTWNLIRNGKNPILNRLMNPKAKQIYITDQLLNWGTGPQQNYYSTNVDYLWNDN